MIIDNNQISSLGIKYIYNRLRQTADTVSSQGAQHIRKVTVGDIFEVEAKAKDYPLLHIATESAAIDTGRVVYSFQLILMDLVSKDESNEEDVLNDTLETLKHFLAYLRMGVTTYGQTPEPEDAANMIRLQESISCEPFTERFDNEVAGWTANIQIEVMYDFDYCNA